MTKDVAPCPFCGFKPLYDDEDFIYKSGRELPDGSQLWQAGCIESAGGCTATVLGRSEEEAFAEWQKRSVEGENPVTHLQAKKINQVEGTKVLKNSVVIERNGKIGVVCGVGSVRWLK